MGVTTDIKTLLTGITSNIYRDDLPDTPDNCIGLFLTGGFRSQHTMGDMASEWERPTLQIRIRHTTADTAISWAESVKDALDGKTNTTINSNRYISIFLMSDVICMGRDEKKRIEYTLNFMCQISRG